MQLVASAAAKQCCSPATLQQPRSRLSSASQLEFYASCALGEGGWCALGCKRWGWASKSMQTAAHLASRQLLVCPESRRQMGDEFTDVFVAAISPA